MDEYYGQNKTWTNNAHKTSLMNHKMTVARPYIDMGVQIEFIDQKRVENLATLSLSGIIICR